MTDPSIIRTRFAPSPTGTLHIGNLRTALFAFLYARHNNGTFVLRIEDTDQNRLVEGALESLLQLMKTVGIEVDEGPHINDHQIKQKGSFGPYIQSERKHAGIYQEYVNQLLKSGKAYYCFCSEERLGEMRKEQMALKKPPMYDRRCRNLSSEQVGEQMAQFEAAGKKPVVRFAIPLEGITVIHDIIYGEISYENKLLDDQVILKSDGFPTYHLAVVVDDHLMEITHVIRGEEWIPSTPKHLLIYEAFGWHPTRFAHLPNILNANKSKLSKRQGDVAAEDFLKKGYSPEVLLNFIALLGWNPKTEQEIFSINELVAQFDLAKVNRAGAVFDPNKLDWLSGQYIKKLSADELVKKLLPYWQQGGIKINDFKPEYFTAVAELERERLKKFSEIGDSTHYFFSLPVYEKELLVWKKADAADAKTKLSEISKLLSEIDENNFTKENLEQTLKKFITENKYDTGAVLWPLRVALTGLDKSPGPFEVAATIALGLGKAEITRRLETAITLL